MGKYKLEIYKDKKGAFCWRRTASNGEIVGASSDSFKSKKSCEANAKSAYVIGWKASEGISRVEGLILSPDMKGMFSEFASSGKDNDARRRQIGKAFGSSKG